MARLNLVPQTQQAREPPPVRPSTPENDAASQQILSEAIASSSHSHTQRQTSAVFGANLLNAARADIRHSSPTQPARKDNRKLSRPSFIAEDLNKNVGPRRNVWDMPESPEKRVFQLPLKGTQKPSKDAQTRPEELQHEDEELLGHNVEEPNLPSSPTRPVSAPKAATHGNSPRQRRGRPKKAQVPLPNGVGQVTLDERLPNGSIRCSVVTYDPKHRPDYKQCMKASTTATKAGPRCATHILKNATVRCTAAVETPNGLGQCRQVAQKNLSGDPLCSKHFKKQMGKGLAGQIESLRTTQEALESVEDTTTKRVREEDNEGHGPARKRRGQLQSGMTQKTSAATETITNDGQNEPHNNVVDPNTIAATQPSSYLGQNRDGHDSSASKNTTSSIDVTQPSQHDGLIQKPAQNSDGTVVGGPSGEVDEDDQIDGPQNSNPVGNPGKESLEDVVDFLKQYKERSGSCQTKIGIDIIRVCRSSIAFLEKRESLTVGTVTDSTENVRAILNLVNEVKEDRRRRNFKMDAYRFLFRALAEYLLALHEWFTDQEADIKQSFDAIYNLAPLIGSILSFKDAIASWKANVGSRRQGDRTIKDVDIYFIAPLRKIGATFNKFQRVLEGRERARKQLADIDKQIEEEERAQREQGEADEVKKKRWARWQSLHVKRMQCEPDPYRRRRLAITRQEALQEKDANGVQFERLPVFKSRTTPPLHLTSSTTGETQWEEDEEQALLEGLQKFAGPRVLYKIFENYCQPGGALRRFTVTDMVIKMAWVRSAWTKLEQEKGWPIPPWVQKIPVLP